MATKQKKTTSELKQEFIDIRSEEVKEYYSELGEWLAERKIELTANITVGVGHDPNTVQIQIVDRM